MLVACLLLLCAVCVGQTAMKRNSQIMTRNEATLQIQRGKQKSTERQKQMLVKKMENIRVCKGRRDAWQTLHV